MPRFGRRMNAWQRLSNAKVVPAGGCAPITTCSWGDFDNGQSCFCSPGQKRTTFNLLYCLCRCVCVCVCSVQADSPRKSRQQISGSLFPRELVPNNNLHGLGLPIDSGWTDNLILATDSYKFSAPDASCRKSHPRQRETRKHPLHWKGRPCPICAKIASACSPESLLGHGLPESLGSMAPKQDVSMVGEEWL